MIFIFLLFLLLCLTVFIQSKKYYQASKLYAKAKILEKQYSSNYNDLAKFKEALAVYRQCYKLVNSSVHKKAIDRCHQKLEDYQQFESLLALGRNKARENYFKTALSNFKQAEKLFSTPEVTNEIKKCHRGIEEENKYEKSLGRANQTAREGDFQAAIDLLIPAVENFTRPDGKKLLNKLQLVIKSRNLYQLGLIAEREAETSKAIALYQQALELIPEYADCNLRLASIAVKNEPQKAINYLKGIEIKRASYLRGFAYFKLGNWQAADREWSAIEHADVASQRKVVRDLLERKRLTALREIEKSVDLKQLATAKSLSIDFLKKYDNDSLVRCNLEKHVYPAIEQQLWREKNWQKIVDKTEKNWLEKQDINSLHNWAIASYYLAQVNPNKLANFIIAWLTALANIESNPKLQNIPWLGTNSIDIQDVLERLKQILENAIDPVKNDSLENYLKLRDIYRRDIVMLTLARQNNCGIETQSKLLILPNHYQKFQQYFPPTRLPTKLWGALYTDWGAAVAACHVGDIARAIKIKPQKIATSEVDCFARALVFYYEGCHYLQNLNWRMAMESLQEAKSEIIIQPEWCLEIDRLSEIQRQQIEGFSEHLEFSKLWYLLIGTQAAKTYYVEYQSMQIGLNVDNQKIDFQQALTKLRELQNIDFNNSVNSNIIETLEVNLELEQINFLWQQSNYEAAVQLALRSQHEKVHFAVAEVCLEIVLEILQSGDLTSESIQSLPKITQWAYELCPTEPQFQAVYSQLKQLGIHR